MNRHPWGGAKLDAALPVRNGVSNSDIVRACRGLLVQGRSDFDAIDGYRGNKFLKEAFGVCRAAPLATTSAIRCVRRRPPNGHHRPKNRIRQLAAIRRWGVSAVRLPSMRRSGCQSARPRRWC